MPQPLSADHTDTSPNSRILQQSLLPSSNSNRSVSISRPCLSCSVDSADHLAAAAARYPWNAMRAVLLFPVMFLRVRNSLTCLVAVRLGNQSAGPCYVLSPRQDSGIMRAIGLSMHRWGLIPSMGQGFRRPIQAHQCANRAIRGALSEYRMGDTIADIHAFAPLARERDARGGSKNPAFTRSSCRRARPPWLGSAGGAVPSGPAFHRRP